MADSGFHFGGDFNPTVINGPFWSNTRVPFLKTTRMAIGRTGLTPSAVYKAQLLKIFAFWKGLRSLLPPHRFRLQRLKGGFWSTRAQPDKRRGSGEREAGNLGYRQGVSMKFGCRRLIFREKKTILSLSISITASSRILATYSFPIFFQKR